MADLINDGSLIGFWPLAEASGAPVWKNYSPAFARLPSGISFDLHVHVAEDGGTVNDDSAGSPWPGQEIIAGPSGTDIRGLKLQGQMDRITAGNSSPYSKILILGNGEITNRVSTLGPAVAQSGFTAGFWVYPRSDGWVDAASEAGMTPGTTDPWFKIYARTHSIMSQWYNDVGWFMGISGIVANATPVTDGAFGPHQLRAYLAADIATGNPFTADTAIEGERYTHITMSYRYVDGTSNEMVLYKDGRVEASGVTSQDIIFDSSHANGPDTSVLSIGAGSDGGLSPTNSLEYGSGWGHLVSGAYFFRRVLHEGEILELHERGGLQPDLSLRDNMTEISIFDDNLVSYIEGKSPGWVDSSKNNYNFLSQQDQGDRGIAQTCDPGPFNVNRSFVDGSLTESVVAPSGATFDVVEGDGGFTICGYIQAPGQATASRRDDNMLISMGSVSTAVTGPATPASVTSNSLGMMLSYFNETGFGYRLTLEAFPVGDGTDGNVALRASGSQIFQSVNMHYSIIYDAGSRGLALYLNGHEAASGTLMHDLQPHLVRLAGSGFPIIFGNGIQNQISDVDTKGMYPAGLANGASGPLALFSRPLRADESRYISQSGINTAPTWRTRHDQRLMGYWPCDVFDLGDVFGAEDKARVMDPLLGHLVRGDTRTKWNTTYRIGESPSDEQVYRDDGTSRVDLFTGETRATVPELASFGNLGITSGTFGPQGGSHFGRIGTAINTDSRNAPFNAVARYRPAVEERDLAPQNLNEYIISFEVTPSGNIPDIDATSHALSTQQHWFNSLLHVYGNLGTQTIDGESSSFLTTRNATGPDPLGFDEGLGGSGVTICFVGRDGSSTIDITPIISGTLPFGVPTRVLLHAKFDAPYQVNEFTGGTAPMTIALYIDGQKVNQRTDTTNRWRLWTDQAPESSNADWILQFGGYAAVDVMDTTTATLSDGGLGEIYMREMFVMRGIFEKDEVHALAASGIQSTTLSGYSNQLSTTQVSIADSALEGYWRFNGFEGNVGQVSNSPGGSGTTDLSLKNNHLDAIAQRYYEEGTSVDLAETQRAMPGPHRNSDLGVQCSGFHNGSNAPIASDPNMLPPHAVSGAGFDTPADGFSVGFLMAKRQVVTNSRFDCVMCYGVLTSTPAAGTVDDTSLDPNRGWAIGMDANDQMKMVISVGGNMYLDRENTPSVANSGQIVCGMTDAGRSLADRRDWNQWQQGDYRGPTTDYWDHYCWTYDPLGGLRCYLNGIKIDERFMDLTLKNPWTGTTVAPQTPVEPTTRMITFKSHQAAGQTPAAWDFRNSNMVDADSVITDVFYFSRVLTEAEVRYAAFNGIDSATGTVTSGVIGGFVHGQDTGSGLIGGYTQGLETGSGHFGGYMPGGTLGSGIVGGFVSGVVFGDGTIGGFVQGLDIVSGVIAGYIQGVDVGSGMVAGYIQGQEVGSGILGGLILGGSLGSGHFGGYLLGSDVGSGHIGGFMLGGLQGNFEFDAGFTLEVVAAKDFDAQLEVAKTTSADFDAKLIIFQDEVGPSVTITIPDNGVSGLAPPFNQYFIGEAIAEDGKSIATTRWTFGDFTSPVSVTESGAGLYPVQHRYATSGFYIAKFEAIDSDGLHASDTRIINAASGIDPVIVSLSGVPRSGDQILTVDFTTTTDILPPGVGLSTSLLNFDDGQTTITFNPTHAYSQPGTYKPVWCVRDTRGFIWCDSLEKGNDLLQSGGGA